MTAPASRRHCITIGSFVVEHGSGRRLRCATFGCPVCHDRNVKRPACGCGLASQDFAAILGVGATVTRNGVLLFQQKAEVAA